MKKEDSLIPLNLIDDKARELARQWCEILRGQWCEILRGGYTPYQEQKLASDIMNYAKRSGEKKHTDLVNNLGELIRSLGRLINNAPDVVLKQDRERLESAKEIFKRNSTNSDGRFMQSMNKAMEPIDQLTTKISKEVKSRNETELKRTLTRAFLIISNRVTDNLGIRVDIGTVFNKDQVLSDIKKELEKLGELTEKETQKEQIPCKKSADCPYIGRLFDCPYYDQCLPLLLNGKKKMPCALRTTCPYAGKPTGCPNANEHYC